MRLRNSFFLALTVGAALGACGEQPTDGPTDRPAKQAGEPRHKLGLMTSLPIYWPLGTELSDFASGNAAVPWQREALEEQFELVPLDTLSPIADLAPDAPRIDPLEGLDRLAIVQPRILSPSDNFALDQWVREGGQLLLVLDPALAGHFNLPLGDPRSPVETALIPPVLARWGLDIVFDEAQEPVRQIAIGQTPVPVALAGTIRASRVQENGVREIAGRTGDCDFWGEGVMVRCALGAGQVTLIADAEAFLGEHLHEGLGGSQEQGRDHDHEDGIRSPAIQALVRIAFD